MVGRAAQFRIAEGDVDESGRVDALGAGLVDTGARRDVQRAGVRCPVAEGDVAQGEVGGVHNADVRSCCVRGQVNRAEGGAEVVARVGQRDVARGRVDGRAVGGDGRGGRLVDGATRRDDEVARDVHVVELESARVLDGRIAEAGQGD